MPALGIVGGCLCEDPQGEREKEDVTRYYHPWSHCESGVYFFIFRSFFVSWQIPCVAVEGDGVGGGGFGVGVTEWCTNDASLVLGGVDSFVIVFAASLLR